MGILDAAKEATERSQFHEEVQTSPKDDAKRQAADKAYRDAVDRVRVHMSGTPAQAPVVQQPPLKFHPPGDSQVANSCAQSLSSEQARLTTEGVRDLAVSGLDAERIRKVLEHVVQQSYQDQKQLLQVREELKMSDVTADTLDTATKKHNEEVEVLKQQK